MQSYRTRAMETMLDLLPLRLVVKMSPGLSALKLECTGAIDDTFRH